MGRSRKKASRRTKTARLEDQLARLLERIFLGLAQLAGHLLRGVGTVLRWLLVKAAKVPRSGQALVVGVVIALVALYLNTFYLPQVRDAPVSTTSEIESLARVIRSEAGGSPRLHQIHVAWATRNLAIERDQTIADMACSPCGRQQRGRPVSSRMGARRRDRQLARAILRHPPDVDPTGGATHFINPVVQDRLAKSGAVPGYKGRTYASVRKRWKTKYGWEPYYRLGPDLEMWGKQRRKKRRR